MSEDVFWTRGKLIAGSIIAISGALGVILGFGRGVISVVDAPKQLAVHDSIAAERMEEFERRLSASRLVICELMGLFPSECPQFTIDHAEDGP